MGFPKKISQLPLNLSLKPEDLLVTVNNNDVTAKVKLEQIISFVTGGTNTFVTGGTYNDVTKNIDFIGSNGFPPFSVNLSGISTTDTFVTGATLNGITLEINRNNGESQISVDLSSLTGSTDTNTFISGTTLVGSDYTLERSDGVDFTTDFNPIVSGKVDTTLFDVYTAITETEIISKLDITTFDTYTANTVDNNTFITGTTLVGTNYTINENNGLSFTTDFNPIISGFTTGNTLQEVIENGSTFSGSETVQINTSDTIILSSNIANTFVGFGLNNTGTTIVYDDNALNVKRELSINNNGLLVTDEIDSKGLEYADDYSANFTNESLITKKYVDSNISGLTDNVVTGATLVGGTLELERNNGLSDVTVDLSSLSGDTNTFVTGATLINTTLDIERNDGVDISVDLSSIDNNIFVDSGNANSVTQQLTFTNTSGGTFNVTNSASLFSDNDINVTGGTYNPNTGCIGFNTNSGTTFDVCGFVTGLTDTFISGTTLVGTDYTLERTDGVNITTDFSSIVSGKVDISLFNSYSADTQTKINDKLDITTFDSYTANTTDNVVTGGTLVGTTLELERNNGLSDVTVDLSALSGISENTFISGTTLVGTDYTLERNDGVDLLTDFKPLVNNKLNITTFDSYTANTTDNVVTGATLVGTTLELERNNGLSDVTVDLSSLTGSTDTNTFVSGATLVGSTLDLERNDGVDISVDLSSLTGSTNTNTFVSGTTLVGNLFTLERNDDVGIITNLSPIVSGKVNTTLFDSYTASTETEINNKLNITTFDSYTANTTDNVVTGATLVGSTLELERNNGLSDVSVDLSSLTGSVDTNTFVTGSTLVGTNYTLKRNDGVNISTNFNSVISGKVETTLFDTYTADTQTEINNKLNITTFDSYTANTTDNVVTGATLVGSTLELERNNGLSDVTVDLSSLTGSTDTNTFVSGATLVGTNYTLKRNDGVDITTDFSSITGGTGGGGNINTGNVLWVDSIFGDDATALTNRQDKPYFTIEQALSDSTVDDVVIVRPGEYDEEDLVIPSNISLVSEGGWEVTIIGKSPATASRNIVELSENSYIDGFSINVPQGSFSGIISSNSAGTSTANNITFYGNGGAGSNGTGLYKTGGGKLIGLSIRVEGGGMTNCLKVDSGTLALEGIHVPQSIGDIDNVLLVTTSGGTNAGRAQMIGFNCGNTNVTNSIRTEGGSSGVIPVAKIFTPNITKVTNAISAEGDYEEINLLGGLLENITYAVKVDLLGTGIEAKYRITSNHQPNYIYPPAVAYTAEFGLDFQQESTEEFNSSKNVFGVPQMSLGFAEKGTQLSVGRGSPTTVGMKVLTTDNTASSVSDGGNLIDVTDDAKSKEGSTITFQSGGTNTTILFTTQRVSADLTTPLKYYGLDLNVLQKKVGGDYIFEYWNGAEWVEDLTHIHSQDLGYSYGNELFLRSQSDENLIFDLSKDSWSAKTIDGTNGYWMRCKTISTGTTKPTIEQVKVIYDSSTISKEGVLSFNGKSLYNEVYNLYNGTWGYPNGTLTDFNVTVGSGSGIETWTHEFLDSQFANGESATFNMKLPQGISTSQKVNLKATYILNGTAAGTTPANLVFSFLPVEVVNVLIADSDGNKQPIPRSIDGTTEFNTYTAQTSSVSSDIGENKVFQLPLGSFDISDYYEGDVVFMRLEKDSGTDVNFNLLSLDFEVSKWSLGKQSEPLELISETIFSEDFEDGGVANGWTTVQNGTLTNLWAISDGTSRGGTNSAYITNDLGGTDVYSYTNGDDQDGAHLYADFTIPSNARSLTLKFYWTCIGENGTGQNSWDFGRVGVSPTTYTPTQEIQFTSDYRVGAASNNNKFNVGYNGGATAGNWVEETIAIPNDLWVAGEDRRLLLYWQNDGSVGSQPPIAIDDITISIEYFN